MANCDFGNPCDCVECRTVYISAKCAECQAEGRYESDGIPKTENYKGTEFLQFSAPPDALEGVACKECGKAALAPLST